MMRLATLKARAALVCIGAAGCLALHGCEQMSKVGETLTPRPQPAPAAGGAAGAASSAAGGNTAAATAKADPAGPASETLVGKRKIPLATFEVDRQCQRLVAPFEITDNLTEIGGLLISGGGDAAASIGSGWLQGDNGKVRGSNVKTQRHQISENIRTAAVRMNWLPMDAEVAYGQYLLDEMKPELLPVDSKIGKRLYPQANRLLEQVLKEVKEPHNYNFQVFVRGTAGQNAAALPGGFVVLDAPLLQDPALRSKALFALSHEIAHVLQRHQTRTAQARIIDTISLRSGVLTLVKSLVQLRNSPGPVIQQVLAGKLQFERHYAAQELQADACATALLDRVLSNRPQVVQTIDNFVKRLPPAEDAAGAAPPAGIKSGSQFGNLVLLVARPVDQHPTTVERIKNFELILGALQARSPVSAPGPGTTSLPKKSAPAKAPSKQPAPAAGSSKR